MNIENFYTFGSTFSRQPVSIKNDKLNWDQYCELVIGDYSNIQFPLIFKQLSGRQWTDVLIPPSVSVCVFSIRFYEILKKNAVTGLQSYPVYIIDNKGKEIYDYVGVSIIGRCGPIDYSKCEIYEKSIVPNGPVNKYYKGLFIGLDKWDGSDFFLPEGTLSIIISERVKELIQTHKVSNIDLKKLSDIEKPEYALPKNR